MTFKDAFAHYRAGTATPEEAALVEEELEKAQLIAEYLDEDWTEEPPQAAPSADYRRIRKRLRLHHLAMIVIPVVIVALLAAMLPFADGLWYDPTKKSYDTFSSTDFDLYLIAYTELFHPGHVYYNTQVTQTGIGQYQLSLTRYGFNSGKAEYLAATLDKGTLTTPREFTTSQLPVNTIARASYPVYHMDEEHKASVRQRLEQLPAYIEVAAAVSFPEDLTMEQLLDFEESLEGYVLWAGIRNSPEDVQRYPLCGLNPNQSGIVVEGMNELYPAFEAALEETSGPMLERHFRSLLQFLADQEAFPLGTTAAMTEPGYYRDVLDYIQENGVKTYGGVICASPQELLELLDSGVITQAWPMDATILF